MLRIVFLQVDFFNGILPKPGSIPSYSPMLITSLSNADFFVFKTCRAGEFLGFDSAFL